VEDYVLLFWFRLVDFLILFETMYSFYLCECYVLDGKHKLRVFLTKALFDCKITNISL